MQCKTLVLVGGGHAHVEVLRRLTRRRLAGVRVILVSPARHMLYSGMLPGVIRGNYPLAQASIDLTSLATAAGADLILGEATAIGLETRILEIAGAAPVAFDLLSLNVGGVQAAAHGGDRRDDERGDRSGDPRSDRRSVRAPGDALAPTIALAVKPIEHFLSAWTRLERTLPSNARVMVVGGGPAGVELTLALAWRYGRGIRLTLVSAQAEPLAEAPPHARRVVRIGLLEAGVSLVSGVMATHEAAGRLRLSDGSFLDAEAVLWANGVGGPDFLSASGLDCDEAGCVRVDACLRSLSHDFVFASGDCAALVGTPRPKAGVWAVRAGGPLAGNLRRAAGGETLRVWRPQREALVILGLGNGRAVAWRNRVAVSGRMVWRWKDWIDRRWVRRFQSIGPGTQAASQRRPG